MPRTCLAPKPAIEKLNVSSIITSHSIPPRNSNQRDDGSLSNQKMYSAGAKRRQKAKDNHLKEGAGYYQGQKHSDLRKQAADFLKQHPKTKKQENVDNQVLKQQHKQEHQMRINKQKEQS